MTRAGGGAGAWAGAEAGSDEENRVATPGGTAKTGAGARPGPGAGSSPTAAGTHRGAPWPVKQSAAARERRAGHRAAAAAALRERFAPDNVRAFAKSSPGLLIAVGLLLIVLCVSAAVVTSGAVGDRQHALDVLLAETEPDAHSAHRLYTSMSIADAAAATAFISGGLEPQTVRERYLRAVGEASAELVVGAADNDTDIRLRTGIATGLPLYTGLVETARADNRSGYPVGAAYLSEASNQMQSTLLPMAEELEHQRSAAVEQATRSHVRPPWTAIVLLLVALAALAWVQTMLARRWRRMLNPGLLAASAAMLLLLGWTVIGGSISAAAMIDGRDQGTVPGSRLVESRILTHQARTAETLKLARRDATGDYDRVFDDAIARITDLLDGYPRDAPATGAVVDADDALARWLASHQRMNDALDRGDYTGAAEVATGSGPSESAAAVDALDAALDDALAQTRAHQRDNTWRSARALDFLAPGALVLGLLAVGGVCAGLWPRLREYR
ncbi:MAG TPA: hypothetical protein VK083_14280 [Nocardia sp.]|uniref:hypothetical protein n=1 Tax=Nocardia sp. TaxID=1821 RepID=UPI002B4AC8C9|nr:hypothetical protein [Nocardia sp.]HLS77948.1 hypothetical protein [Nocardia sp.]